MRVLTLIAAFGFCLGFIDMAQAADKPDPTGTWKWEMEFNGQKRTSSMKLKLEGDKLTGAVLGRNDMETKIEDGKFKDGEVTFKVTREVNGNKMVIHYKGKLDGDTLKGEIEVDRDGEKLKREFEAKREKK